jgi:hypothetical protein
MVSLILLSIICPILALFFESYPRLINRKFGVDLWTHLLYLKEYHKQKGIPKEIGLPFLVSGRYDYPPAFISILSLFPFKMVEKFEFLFSPIFDAIHIILIFFLSYYLSGSVAIAIVAQVLYILTPIIIIENSSATPRSLGYTLFTIVMMSMIFYGQSGVALFLIPAFIAGGLIFLTHRFTSQGFLFFSIILSIVEKNPAYFLVFVASLIIAIFLSRGFYLKVLQGHIGNLKFWRDNIWYRFAHQVKGNIKASSTKDFVFRIYNQFLKFPPFVLAITNPWTLPVLWVFLFEFPKDFITGQLAIWVIISYIFSLLTIWVPRLRFLGEGQRYLELSAFPAAYLSSKFLLEKGGMYIPIYVVVGICAFITILVIQRKAIIKEKLRSVTPEMEQMFSYLKSLYKKPKLLCIPHQITTNVMYHTNCPVFVNADYSNINKISDVYPYIKKPLKEIMRKYELDLILLNEDYATIKDLKIKNFKVIKKVGNFLLIQI